MAKLIPCWATKMLRTPEGIAASPYFGEDIKKLFPIVEPDCSDSGSFDNVLEFLLMSGRSQFEALLMMIPEAWQQHGDMSDAKRVLRIPLMLDRNVDGPASIAFQPAPALVLSRPQWPPTIALLHHRRETLMARKWA